MSEDTEQRDRTIHTDKSVRLQRLTWYEYGYNERYGDSKHGWYLDLTFDPHDGLSVDRRGRT